MLLAEAPYERDTPIRDAMGVNLCNLPDRSERILGKLGIIPSQSTQHTRGELAARGYKEDLQAVLGRRVGLSPLPLPDPSHSSTPLASKRAVPGTPTEKGARGVAAAAEPPLNAI